MQEQYNIPANESGPLSPEQAAEFGLPEKFNGSVEELVKAYTALEKKMGSPEAPEATVPQEAPESPSKAPEAEGLTITPPSTEDPYAALQKAYVESGEVSDEVLAEYVAATGMPEDAARTLVAGMEASTRTAEVAVKEAAGGQEAYAQALEWAMENKSAEEIAAFNEVMSSGNLESMKMAARGLAAEATMALGGEPSLARGGVARSGQPPFATMKEAVAAMQDPQYNISETYRQEVAYRMRNL